jgi:hypothetical protein
MASSFVAGLLVTAAIFLPRVNDPIPEPYFGLDEVDADIETHPRDAGLKQVGKIASAPRSAAAVGALAALPNRSVRSDDSNDGRRGTVR